MQTMYLLSQEHARSHDTAAPADDCGDLHARVLDEIDTGVLVCDEHTTIQTANWSARRELAAGRVLRACGRSLEAATGTAGLRAAIGAACKSGRRAVLLLRGGDQTLYVSVSPLTAPDDRSLALVMLGRREPCSRIALELLGMQQGLTAAERKVLAGLAGQRSPAQIASDHRVALSTVRTQIKALRAKLGVKSQQALVCLVGTVPPLATALRLTAVAPAARASSPIEGMHYAA